MFTGQYKVRYSVFKRCLQVRPVLPVLNASCVLSTIAIRGQIRRYKRLIRSYEWKF